MQPCSTWNAHTPQGGGAGGGRQGARREAEKQGCGGKKGAGGGKRGRAQGYQHAAQPTLQIKPTETRGGVLVSLRSAPRTLHPSPQPCFSASRCFCGRLGGRRTTPACPLPPRRTIFLYSHSYHLFIIAWPRFNSGLT